MTTHADAEVEEVANLGFLLEHQFIQHIQKTELPDLLQDKTALLTGVLEK